MVEEVQLIIDRLKVWLGNIDLKSLGSNMLQGFINGVRSKASELADAARAAVRGAIQAARNALDAKSPSRVFFELGEMSDEGFIGGINKKADEMAATVQGAVANAISSGQAAMSGGLAMNGSLAMAGGAAYGGGGSMSIDRSRTINVEMNPTYEGTRSVEESRLDIYSAINSVFV